jgi:hypothetical protein
MAELTSTGWFSLFTALDDDQSFYLPLVTALAAKQAHKNVSKKWKREKDV